jgi:2-methylcitrate dehydratase PrpD
MASLSRQLAQWVANLRYEDLPPEVIDRAKGVTLHNLISALIGSQTSGGKDAVSFVTGEESTTKNGASVLVNGAKVTKTAAAYANTEMMRTGGKLDSYRMLTHPGTTIIPGALVAAETNGASGRDFITGIAAGYEVMGRIAGDFIPTLMSRGFHPSPVFGLFGAAVAAAKILRMTEEQVNAAIGFCVSLAASNVEGPHSGGRALREGAAARNAVFAVSLAQRGHPGGETVLEGKSGFYHSYIGNNFGQLAYSFTGEAPSSLQKVTAGLGKDWLFLETLYRIYSIAGYNIAHVAIAAKLCEENDLKYEDIDRIEAMVNWLETQYPSPAFRIERSMGRRGPAAPPTTRPSAR